MQNMYVFRPFRPILLFILTVTGAFVWAAPSFHADKNYPNLGLRIRVLGNSEPEPLPQYKTYTYTFTQGDEHFKRDLYDPVELWYATQHAGQWRDAAGNLLILGRPTRQLPTFNTQLKHIARDVFDQAMADPATAFDPTRPEAITAWVASFSACTPQTPEPLRTSSFNLVSAVFFPVEQSSTLVYAFRVKVRQPNGQAVPSDWYCAVIRIADGTPKSKVRKDFESQFLANVAGLPTGGAAASGVQSKALTPASNQAKTPAVADSPSRSAARKSIANMKDWWYAETPDYIFLSNIRSATGRSLVKDLQTAMPSLHTAFAALIPPFQTATDVSVVRICDTEEVYRQYVGKRMEWSIGVWNPMRRELVVLAQGKDTDKTLEIIRHEGFHQYLFYATQMIENAPWFNEGHACFFESARVDAKGRVEIEEDARCEHLLRNLDVATSRIPKVIHLSYDEFYSGSEEQRSLNYTTSWALVYFLRKGAPAERKESYAAILDTYLKALATSRNCDTATTEAFEKIDMARFQADFESFWKRGRSAARRYDCFAQRTAEGQR